MNIKRSLIALPLLLSALPAQANTFPILPPHLAEDRVCFMHTQQGPSLDLTPLCGGEALTPANTPIAPRTPRGGILVPAESRAEIDERLRREQAEKLRQEQAENPCQFPWQTAADGSLCGARAASERQGGE